MGKRYDLNSETVLPLPSDYVHAEIVIAPTVK